MSWGGRFGAPNSLRPVASMPHQNYAPSDKLAGVGGSSPQLRNLIRHRARVPVHTTSQGHRGPFFCVASKAPAPFSLGCSLRVVCWGGRQKAATRPPSLLDQNTVFDRLMGMTPSRAEYYRGRAEDCCRSAIRAESVDRRLHWLEAAARWISLAREEGTLPPRQSRGQGDLDLA